RRTRKLSTRLGQPPKVDEEAVQHCLNPSDPVHYHHYRDQVDALKLNCHPKVLQRKITQLTGAKRFKRPRTSYIRVKNKRKRIEYGTAHCHRTIRGFWRFVYFTDEVHFNSRELSTSQDYELRQPGSEARMASIQENSSAGINVTVY